MPKTFLLSGSHRASAESLKVTRFIEQAILRAFPGRETFLYSLSENPIPLWDENEGGASDEHWAEPARHLGEADSLVVVCPEWNGMVTSGVKNFLHLAGADLVGHKAGLIVTVSASDNGVYPVSELRMNGTKNNRLCWIPEHLIIRQVGKVWNGEEPDPAVKSDAYLRKRLNYCLKLLDAYGHALTTVRESGLVDHQAFPNGM